MAEQRLAKLPRDPNSTKSIVGYYPELQGKPIQFCDEVLGLKLWKSKDPKKAGQWDIVAAVADHESVACRSGHKVGKSTAAAAIALYWYSCYPEARAILTAPTHRQVARVLWKEVRRLIRKSLKPISVPSTGVPKLPHTGLESEDGRELWGFTTDDPEKFSGISGEYVLYICDEAPGIGEDIFEAIEGNRAGGAKLIMLGNPRVMSGTFYTAFHTGRRFWRLFHIDSRTTPNARPGTLREEYLPGLATGDWCEARRESWGEDSAIFAYRVVGDFPKQAENAVISLALLERSREAHTELNGSGGELELGVDPARYGDDDIVIAPVRGKKQLPMVVFERGLNTIEIAGEVLKLIKELGGTAATKVKIDTVGLGAGVFDQLDLDDSPCEAFSVESGRKADGDDNEKQYYNLRAQLHFNLREWMKDGGGIVGDPILEGELVAPTYSFDVKNRYKVESKDDIKERIKHSPDRMDALALAVYQPPPKPSADYDERYDDDAHDGLATRM